MFQWKFALAALTLELAAWLGALKGESGDLALLAYLAAHAGAAATAAVLFRPLLPPHLRGPRLPALLFMFGAAFAVPVLGFAALAAGVFQLRRLSAPARTEPFRAVALPAIDPHQRTGSGFRQAGLSSFLANSRAPEPARLHALVALQNVPTRLASPLLRNVLADPNEDIRLLAYGILDSREKLLNDAIHRERARLSAAAADPERLDAMRHLSDLYWELVYQELAQGDLRSHALEQSLGYTRAVLEHGAADAALHLRLGRLQQMLGRLEEAQREYGRALALGMPRTRVTPYLAEIAYHLRDFAAVRAFMAELGGWESLTRLRPLIKYWMPQ